MSPTLATRPVRVADLDTLARLFDTARTTRHCWCMAFCSGRARFAAGWYGGGNRRAFTAPADSDPHPMGILATSAGEPVGWCAAGPRSRYVAATTDRDGLMPRRSPAEDESVWLVPCVFVHPHRRGQGISYALVEAAMSLARAAGAAAVESWPVAGGGHGTGNFVGREKVFAAHGFAVLDRPAPGRVLMRCDLPPAPRA